MERFEISHTTIQIEPENFEEFGYAHCD
jgi:hypothetical protein